MASRDIRLLFDRDHRSEKKKLLAQFWGIFSSFLNFSVWLP
jgi:hypothetical protein